MKFNFIFILIIARVSFCNGSRLPLLSKDTWNFVTNHLDPKIDKKLSLMHVKLSGYGISAYDNIKAKVCPENRASWGFLKYLKTEKVIVENDFGILPEAWNEAVRDAHLYRKSNAPNEMKSFIQCMAHCFDLSEMLWEAVRCDYADLIEFLFDAKFQVNENVRQLLKIPNVGSVILHSCWIGRESRFVRVLIELGIDVNFKNNQGRTSLYWAVRKNREKIVQMLLEAGATDVNTKDNDGLAPIHWAAGNENSEEIVRMLIKANANLNTKDEFGWTALHCAARENNLQVAKILIDAGANTEVEDSVYRYGRTPLDIAISSNHRDFINILPHISYRSSKQKLQRYVDFNLERIAESCKRLILLVVIIFAISAIWLNFEY